MGRLLRGRAGPFAIQACAGRRPRALQPYRLPPTAHRPPPTAYRLPPPPSYPSPRRQQPHLPRPRVDPDPPLAVADAGDEAVAPAARELEGDAGVDATAAGVDVEHGAERGGHAQRHAARAGVDEHVVDVAGELEIHVPAARVETHVPGAHGAEAHAAGAEVEAERGGGDVGAGDAPGAGVDEQRVTAHARDLDGAGAGVEDDVTVGIGDLHRAGARVDHETAARAR